MSNASELGGTRRLHRNTSVLSGKSMLSATSKLSQSSGVRKIKLTEMAKNLQKLRLK
jgi:hypothetical protein